MKRPSWPTIILGFLNIVAAVFLMVLASRAFYARYAWSRHIQDGLRHRDGQVAFGETAETDESEQLLEGLSDASKKEIDVFLSRYARRGAAGTAQFDPYKNSIQKLNSADLDNLIKKIGGKDMARLIQNHYVLRHPELRAEEQQLAQQKATELFRLARLDKEIAQLDLDLARINADLTAEKERKDLQLVENEERKKELCTVYAELEEWIHARMLAEGRLRDLQRHLERTRQKHEEIRRQNTALEELIRRMEGIAAPGGN